MATTDNFPRLPVVDFVRDVVAEFDDLNLSGVSIVAVQHLLESTGTLFESLIRLGADPEHIHLIGKPYSRHEATSIKLKQLGINVYSTSESHNAGDFGECFQRDVDAMWAEIVTTNNYSSKSGMIVLDDGGRCLGRIPRSLQGKVSIVGIEQTTSGIRQKVKRSDQSFSAKTIVQVASSAAKTLLESELIAAATVRRIGASISDKQIASHNVGVVGLGNIGRAMANYLASRCAKVLATDIDPSARAGATNLIWCDDAFELINDSDFIIGCTGMDLFAAPGAVDRLCGEKIFFSASSEDIEFSTLLKLAKVQVNHNMSLPDIVICRPGFTATIANSGFPVNFDNSGISVPNEDIQITRALLLGAVVQARRLIASGRPAKSRTDIMLDPSLQQAVVSRWLASRSVSQFRSPAPTDLFDDVDGIIKMSGGLFTESTELQHLFTNRM